MTRNILARMPISEKQNVYKNRVVASFQMLKNRIIKLLLSCITKLKKIDSNYIIYQKKNCFSNI